MPRPRTNGKLTIRHSDGRVEVTTQAAFRRAHPPRLDNLEAETDTDKLRVKVRALYNLNRRELRKGNHPNLKRMWRAAKRCMTDQELDWMGRGVRQARTQGWDNRIGRKAAAKRRRQQRKKAASSTG